MHLGRALRIGVPALAGFLATTAAFEIYEESQKVQSKQEQRAKTSKDDPRALLQQQRRGSRGIFNPLHGFTQQATYDLAIVGAGIVGSSTAMFAKQLNPNARVVLIDASSVASGASSHSAGTMYVPEIIPRGDNDNDETRVVKPNWDEILASETLQCYRDLENEGLDCELEESGGVLVAGNEDESLYIAQVYLDLVDRGFTKPRLLDSDAGLNEIEPRLKCHSALYLPFSAHVDPMLATISMAAQAQRLGVEIRNDFRVVSVKSNTPKNSEKSSVLGENVVDADKQSVNGDYYEITSADGHHITASKVVIANGIHASKLLPERIKIVPVKGQIVLSEEKLPPKTLRSVIFSASAHAAFAAGRAGKATDKIPAELTHDENGVALCRHLYGRQRRDGHILMGGGRIPVLGPDLDYKPNRQVLEGVAEHTLEILDLKEARLHDAIPTNSWACYMPFSIDSKPYLGELQESHGLYVAAGFGPEGMTWGPGAGKILASLIWKGQPADTLDAVVLKELDPNRRRE